ncbi:peptidylprolyl isomerase [Methyloprofundus sp.]|uniref:peptidylprolyl isomerase n=1 Tax=Methyloprofundus sp. TaxID=2020875 RepID=UPI003D123015
MKKSLFNQYAFALILYLGLSPLLCFASNPLIDIQTSEGLVTVELAADKAPLTTENFLSYVEGGFYNNTLFHRVVDDFLIQGGGYTATLELKENKQPIVLELGEDLSHVRGSIAMARRSSPDSARSQFFINTVDNLRLDELGYAVFGKVIAGMNVVDSIGEVATESVAIEAGTLRNVPKEPVIIEAIRPRTGQLSFVALHETYAEGEVVAVTLVETIPRFETLDLWVAVQDPAGRLFFVGEAGFSATPVAFKSGVAESETSHPVIEFRVPKGLAGQYTLLAAFNQQGAEIEDLIFSLRSNIAQTRINFKLE